MRPCRYSLRSFTVLDAAARRAFLLPVRLLAALSTTRLALPRSLAAAMRLVAIITAAFCSSVPLDLPCFDLRSLAATVRPVAVITVTFYSPVPPDLPCFDFWSLPAPVPRSEAPPPPPPPPPLLVLLFNYCNATQ